MSDNIVVSLRVRPLIARELNDNTVIYWKSYFTDIVQIDPETKSHINTFTFDRVFGAESTNQDLYDSLALPIVQASLTGINGTIFAYGQTSSGKTHTMSGMEEDRGIIPLLIQSLFQSIENMPDREFLLRASYMEIYKEQVFDLLTETRIHAIREDVNGQVLVPGLKEVCVTSEEMLYSVMIDGNKRRKVGETQMNKCSSRSHSIFRVIVESRERDDRDCDGGVTVSHLNLVDLAGSENASQTGAHGERLKEGSAINKSLFMLGRVISQLSEGEQFINFRDSKLTRILQNSLGGNAKTVIICNVTPANRDQTLSTVRFALSAKSIKNKPIINEVLSESALLKRYAIEIKQLKIALKNERNTDKAHEMEQVKEKLDEQEKRNSELQAKILSLKEKLVVSSHSATRENGKDKKSRRETWSAPLTRRPFSLSLPPQLLEVHYNNRYLAPPLGFVGTSRPLLNISEETTTTPESTGTPSFNNTDSCFDTSIKTREECFERDELSKLLSINENFLSPQILPKSVRRKRRRKSLLVDAQCQTEDSLLPRSPFLKCTFRTPAKKPRDRGERSPFMISPSIRQTPKDVLRSINIQLKVALESKEAVLKDWQEELQEMEELHENELNTLRVEFEERVENGFFSEKELDGEVQALKKSLEDASQIYLDANKTVSEQSDRIKEMEERLAHLEDENARHLKDSLQNGLLEEELGIVKRELNKKKRLIQTLERDKSDFDLRMELAFEKQKQTEAYLRNSLDEAWKELAKYEENSDYSAEERAAQKVELLTSSLAAEKRSKADLEELVSKLELELCQTREMLRKEKRSSTCGETESEFQRSNEKSDVKPPKPHSSSFVEWAREMSIISGWESMYMCPDRASLEVTCLANLTTNPSEVSRKLSETLHLLDESLSGNVDSLSRDFPVDLSEVLFIRQQLLNLQEMLMTQEIAQQQDRSSDARQTQPDSEDLSVWVVAQIQDNYNSEIEVIRLLEVVSHDYIHHANEERLYGCQQLVDPLPTIPATSLMLEPNLVEDSISYFEGFVSPFDYSLGLNGNRSHCDNILTLADDLCMTALNETDLEETEHKVDRAKEIMKERGSVSTVLNKEHQEKDEELNLRAETPPAIVMHFPQVPAVLQEASATPLPSQKLVNRGIWLQEDLKALKVEMEASRSAAQETISKLEKEKGSLERELESLRRSSGAFLGTLESDSDAPSEALPLHSLLSNSVCDLNLQSGSELDKVVSVVSSALRREAQTQTDNLRCADVGVLTDIQVPSEPLHYQIDAKSMDVEKVKEEQLLALQERVREQERVIKSLHEELKELHDQEEELDSMITEFTWKEEQLEEKERRMENQKKSMEQMLEEKSQIIHRLESKIFDIEIELKIFKSPRHTSSQKIGEMSQTSLIGMSQTSVCQSGRAEFNENRELVRSSDDGNVIAVETRPAQEGEHSKDCCKALLNQINEMIGQKENIMNDLELLQRSCSLLERENGTLNETRKSLKNELQDLKQALCTKKGELEDLSSKHISLCQELESASSTIEALKREVSQLKEFLALKEQRWKTTSQSPVKEQAEMKDFSSLKEKEGKALTLEEELEEKKVEVLKERLMGEESNCELDFKLKDIKEKSRSFENELKKRERAVCLLQDEIGLFKNKIAALESSLEKLRAEFAKKDEERVNEIAALNEEMEGLKEKNLENFARESTLLEQIKGREREMSENKQKLDTLCQKLQRVEKENKDYQNENDILKARVNKMEFLEERFDIRDLEDVAKLLEKASSEREELMLKDQKYEGLALRLKTVEEQKRVESEALKGKIETLLEQARRYEDEAKEKEATMKSLYEDVSVLKVECEHYCRTLTSKEEKSDQARGLGQRYEEELSTLREMLRKKEEEYDALISGCENLKLILAKKEVQLKEFECVHENELATVSQALRKKEEELDAANKAFEAERRRVELVETCLQAKELECNQSELKVKLLEEDLNVSGRQVNKFEKIRNALEAEVDRIRETLTSMRVTCDNLVSERDKLKEELKQKEENISCFTSECDSLKADLDALQAEKEMAVDSVREKEASLQRQADLLLTKEATIKALEEMKITHAQCSKKESLDAAELERLTALLEKHADCDRLRKENETSQQETKKKLATLEKVLEGEKRLRDCLEEIVGMRKLSETETKLYNDKFYEAQKDLETLRYENEGLSTKLKKVENEKDEEMYRKTISKLESDLFHAEDALRKISIDKEDVLKRQKRMEEELREETQSYDALSAQYDRVINIYQAQIDGLSDSVKGYMSKVKFLQQKNQRLSEMANSRDEGEENTSDNVSKVRSVHEVIPKEEASSLRRENDSLKNEVEKLKMGNRTTASFCNSCSSSLRTSKQKLMEKVDSLTLKVYQLTEEVDNLRCNKGIIGSTEELEKQLEWMRKEQQKTEFLNERLNQNYDLLEKENAELEMKNREMRERLTEYERNCDSSGRFLEEGPKAGGLNSPPPAAELEKLTLVEEYPDCDRLRKENETAQQETKVRLATMEKTLLEGEKRLRDCLEEMARVKSLKEIETKFYRDKFNEAKKDLETLRSENEVLRTKLKTVENEKDEEMYRKTISKLEGDQPHAEDAFRKISIDKEDVLKRQKRMEEELREKTQSYNALSAEYDRAIDIYQDRINGLTESLEGYMSKVKSLQRENQRLSEMANSKDRGEENTTPSDNVNKVRSVHEAIPKEEAGSLRRENDSMKNEVEELKMGNRATANLCNSSSASSRTSKQKLVEKVDSLTFKVYQLTEEVDNLRSNKGIIGSTEELEKQLEWMRKEQQKTEFLNERLNQNYDLLEKENAELEMKNREMRERLTEYERNCDSSGRGLDQTTAVDAFTMEELRSSYEKEVRTELIDSDEEISRGSYFELKRENKILEWKLEALNAPAKKEAQQLKDELDTMRRKNKKLLDDLRRLQNSNAKDLSMMERNPQTAPVCEPKSDLVDNDVSCGFGSKIVLDVVVMRQSNTIYHIEKDNSKLKWEVETLKKHVDHYKLKSDEWKTKCYKESIRVQEAEDRLKNSLLRTQAEGRTEAMPMHSAANSVSPLSVPFPTSESAVRSSDAKVTPQKVKENIASSTQTQDPPTGNSAALSTNNSSTSNICQRSTIASRTATKTKSPRKQTGKENRVSKAEKDCHVQ